MTEKEAIKRIVEDGINLGAGDYVDVEALKVAVNALEEIQKYREIGTVEEFRDAMEKQKEKKPRYKYLKSLPNCPTCGEVNLQKENEYGNVVENHSHCSDCGQAIDWSES